jgi:hypothetical protein
MIHIVILHVYQLHVFESLFYYQKSCYMIGIETFCQYGPLIYALLILLNLQMPCHICYIEKALIASNIISTVYMKYVTILDMARQFFAMDLHYTNWQGRWSCCSYHCWGITITC